MSQTVSFDDARAPAGQRASLALRAQVTRGTWPPSVVRLPALDWPRDLFSDEVTAIETMEDDGPLPNDIAAMAWLVDTAPTAH